MEKGIPIGLESAPKRSDIISIKVNTKSKLPDFPEAECLDIITIESDDEHKNQPIIAISSETSDEMESDDTNTVGSNKQIILHNNKIPIYAKPKKSLEASQIFKLCFGELQDDYICNRKPVSVRYNAVFVIDLQAVDMRSLYADDNGVWSISTPRSYHRILLQDGKIESVVKANKETYSHFIKRQYGTHQATLTERGVTFQRIISSVFNKDGHRSRYCVVQYIHRDGSEKDIVVKSHGNARNPKRPFFKTEPEVLENIKEEPLDAKPRKVFKSLIDKAGGPLHSLSASSEPRNLQQIYNIRRSQSASKKTDDFIHLVSQIKESSFVHNLTIDSNSVQYTLVSEKQLTNMKLFCTHPIQFSVFSIDSTYDVGNYFVTNTCFENFKVVHADGKYRGRNPMEIGPTFIHTGKDTNTFVGLFSSLLRMEPELKTLQAIGSDGDEAIMNASLICFPDAQKLLCYNHKKENIERKLKGDLRARDAPTKHILYDIFDRETAQVYEQRLIDSTSTATFERKLMELKSTWDYLVPSFHTWFVQYEADVVKRHLIKEVTMIARIEDHFTNNRTESIHCPTKTEYKNETTKNDKRTQGTHQDNCKETWQI